MNPARRRLIASGVVLVFAAPLFSQTVYQRTTVKSGDSEPYCIPWIDSGSKAGIRWAATASYAEIFPDSTYQTIQGFGGCFQEKMWDALNHLSVAGRDSVIRALFDTSGCNFTVCRLPIGCCEFDNNRPPYSFDDSAGDYAIRHFDATRDSLYRIPLIKWAQAYQPNLRIWASPWSPPGWMKSNNTYHGGSMKTDSATLAAYALYLEKAIQWFKSKGVSIESITCQNKPDQNSQDYPTCGWSNENELKFYKEFMIPLFLKDGISTRIILGVYCCGNYADWITYFMNDTTVRKFVNATSHSYQTNTWGPQAYAAYPTIPFYETESNYGSLGAASQVQDWSVGWTIFNTMAPFLATGRAAVYDQWNMVNNQKCQSGWGWAQYVMITIDTTNGHVTYNPHFYAQKHFSHYVKVGAKSLKCTSHNLSNFQAAAFLNPNGDIILVAGSSSSSANPVAIKVGNGLYNVVLPPNSFNTFRIVNANGVVGNGGAAGKAWSGLTDAYLRNSTLHFTLSPDVKAEEADFLIAGLQGRTIWVAHRTGSTLACGQQAIAVGAGQGKLRTGSYLFSVRIRTRAGKVSVFSKRLLMMR